MQKTKREVLESILDAEKSASIRNGRKWYGRSRAVDLNSNTGTIKLTYTVQPLPRLTIPCTHTRTHTCTHAHTPFSFDWPSFPASFQIWLDSPETELWGITTVGFYRPDAPSVTQPTASKLWKKRGQYTDSKLEKIAPRTKLKRFPDPHQSEIESTVYFLMAKNFTKTIWQANRQTHWLTNKQTKLLRTW